ncbi:DNA-binding transcriptional LysR family regulator [Microbacterium phyllosphaerae]|uniref:DNA-binding transcriptional LysR family regulator n=1 Tax=Microbacterium phyllosphaerae TaxID=124798 RepID=A0ABS4WRP8_9MICO|nr:LysR family transcriptional regulator [Microbacterium phyllosphaerae]MBP2378608.1 DNA-binding transcriptional LysR family regulator [Microbacterium phyllosphaerae]
MDLQQLRYVVEVASTSSFTRAAERCFVTQSALSHQIAALERELGQRLFIRSSRSVRTTDAGEAFLVHAKKAVIAADDARDAAAAASGRIVGTLRLGVIPTASAVSVPRVVSRFREAHPDARVELTVGNSGTLADAVRRGDLDIALLGLREGSVPKGVAVRVLARERLVAAVAPTHRLSGRTGVRIVDLVDEVFADFPAGTSGRAQGDAAFASSGVARDVAFEADSSELILGLVSEGLAIALLAPAVIVGSSTGAVAVELADGPTRVQYVAWDDRAPRGVAIAFLEVIDSMIDVTEDETGPEESSGPASSEL